MPNDDWQEYVGVPQDFCYFISNFLSTHLAQLTVYLVIPHVSVLVKGPTQNHISDMSVTYKKYLQKLPNFKAKCMSWTSFIYTCTVHFVTKGAQTGTKKWKCLIFWMRLYSIHWIRPNDSILFQWNLLDILELLVAITNLQHILILLRFCKHVTNMSPTCHQHVNNISS